MSNPGIARGDLEDSKRFAALTLSSVSPQPFELEYVKVLGDLVDNIAWMQVKYRPETNSVL